MRKEDEAYHLKRLKSGDRQSFGWIFETHHQTVYRYCLTILGFQMTAEEVTADVFLRLWQKREMVQTDTPVLGLLLKIAKDYLWNHLKKEARINRQKQDYFKHQTTSQPAKAEDVLILKDYIRFTDSLLKDLPEKRRKVFILHYKLGFSRREIAQRMDISESTVRVQLFKAVKYLKEKIKNHLEWQNS